MAAMEQEASFWNDGNVLYLNCKVLITQLYKYIKYLTPQMKGGREKNGRKKRRRGVGGEKEGKAGEQTKEGSPKLHFFMSFLLFIWWPFDSVRYLTPFQ